MFKNIIQLGLIVFLLSNLLSSCALKKNVIYFQGEEELYAQYKEHVPKIRPYDMLTINVSALDAKASTVFNRQGGAEANTYTVAEDGTIDFPLLGKVKLADLTRNEAIDLLKMKLGSYIVEPGVNMNFSNFKISLLGEVSSPGVYTISNERITILEAIAMAGDLGIRGRRNVMVLREEDGKVTEHYIDLTSKTAFNSPVYYLEQNDVVYVEPNNVGVQSSQLGPTFWMTLTSFGLSVTTSILTLMTRIEKTSKGE